MIPVLYELGRELYDRRTGLIAAAFAAVSPVLIWYAQKVRMYEFIALFGLLALLTQLRVIRHGTMLNWAAYILATAGLSWSHYFGLLLIAVQQVVFLAVLVHRRRHGQPSKALALGFAYSAAILVMQLVPLLVFAHHQYQVTSGAAGSPSGTYDLLSFYSVLANLAWALWGYQPDATTVLLAAAVRDPHRRDAIRQVGGRSGSAGPRQRPAPFGHRTLPRGASRVRRSGAPSHGGGPKRTLSVGRRPWASRARSGGRTAESSAVVRRCHGRRGSRSGRTDPGGDRVAASATGARGVAAGRAGALRWAIAVAGLVVVAVGMVTALMGISSL